MWSCLETSSVLNRSAAVWQRDLGPHFTAFRSAFLHRRPETARSYPCPRGCGCVHEVIQHAPDDLVAVCRCERWNCDDLPVSPAEITCWELSWSKLGLALCRALSLDHRPAAPGPRNTRQIGAWGDGAVPVILAIQPDPRLFRQALLELVSRLQHPFILLAPTARHLAAPALELLARARAGFFDLQSCVRLMPGRALEPLRPPGELFMRFTAEPRPEDESVWHQAFALARALDTEISLRAPTPLAVFREYCQEGANISQIARKFHCSRATVLNRLKLIRRRTGLAPERLRRLSPHLAPVEETLAESRARRIDPRALLEHEEEES